MVLTEICPKDAQGSSVSNAEQDQNLLWKPEKAVTVTLLQTTKFVSWNSYPLPGQE